MPKIQQESSSAPPAQKDTSGAEAATAKVFENFTNSLKGFSQSIKQGSMAPVKAVAGQVGQAVGGFNQRRIDAGITQEGAIDAAFGESPLLKALAGGTVDLGNQIFGGIMDTLGFGSKDPEKESLEAEQRTADATEKLVDIMDGDAGDSLADIEAEREAKKDKDDDDKDPDSKDKKKKSGLAGGISGILGALGSVFSNIPGFGVVSKLFSGGLGGITKLFGKLFWPITLVTGIISFVTGFMEGYEEDGLQGGITKGFEKLIENLIDVPLNFLKDTVAFIAGLLGFEEFEKQLNDMGEIDISSYVKPVVDFIFAIPEKIKEMFNSFMDAIKDNPIVKNALAAGGAALDWGKDFLGFGDDEEDGTDDSGSSWFSWGSDDEKAPSSEAMGDSASQPSAPGGVEKYNEPPKPEAKPSPGVSKEKPKKIPLKQAFESLNKFEKAALLDTSTPETPAGLRKKKARIARTAKKLKRLSGYEYKGGEELQKALGESVVSSVALSPSYPSSGEDTAMPSGGRHQAAASHIQDAGIAASSSASAPVVINAGGGGGGGYGGSAQSVPLPIPMDMRTDPTLSEVNNL